MALSSAISALPWSSALQLVPDSCVGLTALGGHWSYLLEVFRRAEKSLLKLDVVFYSQAMERCAWQRSATLLLKMEKAWVRPNAFSYSALVSGSARAEQWEYACATACGQNLAFQTALANVAIGALSVSQWLLCSSFLSENRLRSLQPDAISLSSVGDSFAAEWEKGLWWLMKIRMVPMPESMCTTGCSVINALETRSLWRPLGVPFGSFLQALDPNASCEVFPADLAEAGHVD